MNCEYVEILNNLVKISNDLKNYINENNMEMINIYNILSQNIKIYHDIQKNIG